MLLTHCLDRLVFSIFLQTTTPVEPIKITSTSGKTTPSTRSGAPSGDEKPSTSPSAPVDLNAAVPPVESPVDKKSEDVQVRTCIH